jgi:hypothetical protein
MSTGAFSVVPIFAYLDTSLMDGRDRQKKLLTQTGLLPELFGSLQDHADQGGHVDLAAGGGRLHAARHHVAKLVAEILFPHLRVLLIFAEIGYP